MADRSGVAVGIALAFAVARGAVAAAVEVQVPASTAIAAAGQSATVALSIAPVGTQDGVFAGAFSLTYAGAVVSATSATPAALLATCTTTSNLTTGRVTLIFACTQPLASGGALFTVAFQGVAVGVSPLTFSATDVIPSGCLLNEGSPACQATGGELVVGAPPATASATATGSPAATPTRTVTPTNTATRTVPPTPTGGVPASGHLVQDLFRASDGTAYQLLRVLPQADAAEAVRITTVAGTSQLIGGCAAAGGTAGSGASAVAGAALPSSQTPFTTVRRTALLLPLDATAIAFDAAQAGRLRIGAGAGATTVCASSIDCVGQPNVAPLVGIDSTSGGVAAACVAAPIDAICDASERQAFAFAVPATGAPPSCLAAPTTDTTVCAAEPGDGFRLVTGQALVFVYGDDLASTGFGVGVAGFGIDLDGTNPSDCAAGEVVSATALTTSQPAPPLPTATATAPPTPTRGRAPIPVAPSPFSGAGLLLLGGLTVALLVALRRRIG